MPALSDYPKADRVSNGNISELKKSELLAAHFGLDDEV